MPVSIWNICGTRQSQVVRAWPAKPVTEAAQSGLLLLFIGVVVLIVCYWEGASSDLEAAAGDHPPESNALEEVRAATRGPGRKHGTPVSVWQQQMMSRIGVSDHTWPSE